MKINILAFGIARDILGESVLEFEWNGEPRVGKLKEELQRKFPKFTDLASLKIAVNEAYAKDELEIHEGDEVVIIPPVSGG
ncbi:MAG: MoaD/ThiS family protein [Bacteroidia bacterium]|nr:MoaD/ThiS family protein [Bacteroidia bacterium]